MKEDKVTRREFLKDSAMITGIVGGACSMPGAFTESIFQSTENEKEMSDVYRVNNCPVPKGENYHKGLYALLNLMGEKGLKFYKTDKAVANGGKEGMIEKDDIVLIKVNAQWKYRGCTNSDLIRGLIQRILEHPDGFDGEIVIFENGQGLGSFDCDMMWGGRYPDTGVHANAEDESHSFSYLVDKVFSDDRVSKYLLDLIREKFISFDDHSTDGYRRFADVSYPCFTTAKGNRVELKEGIWNGKNFEDKIKLINVPVLKHHAGCGVTAALKHFYGILSMADGTDFNLRHYQALGEQCGKMISLVRAPVINILDCIWVSLVHYCGYPPENTVREDQLLASVDPVALDYWAGKYVLCPLDEKEHHPDKFPGFRNYLVQAKEVINSNGGINGQKVAMDEENINVMWEISSAASPSQY